MSDDSDRRLTADLIAGLEALLERAANGPPPPETAWQGYAGELRALCQRVLEEADDQTAVAFWIFLVETAARHGRRAGGWPA